jgi:MFS transporter, PAT family, beta-lactamase induction signal transducer AmpG
VYFEKRVLIILFLGFSAGLPLALSASTLAIWMADRGVDLGAIGLYSLAGLPYTLKFLWAPVVDAFRVPVLARYLGRRRGWLVFSQLLLMAAILTLGSLDPVASPYLIALAALLVATASATQDIVIDAFRVESLPENRQAAGMAYYVSAYRIALLVSTAGFIALVAYLETRGIATEAGWGIGYALMAGLVVVGMAAAWFAVEPEDNVASAQPEGGVALQRFWRTARDSFADFLTKDKAVLILLFVIFYKLGDTLAGVMTGPFVLAIGFDLATYAAIVKGVGLAAALAGGFLGGYLALKYSLMTNLWVAGLLQMASNLVFCWQAWIGPDPLALSVTIITENFSGAIGTVIFVAYLSGLCTNKAHTATQFALLTALAAVGRTILSSGSGFAAEAVGWAPFFALTALAALPGLALLWWLGKRSG